MLYNQEFIKVNFKKDLYCFADQAICIKKSFICNDVIGTSCELKSQLIHNIINISVIKIVELGY